jgi:hypothetical protein
MKKSALFLLVVFLSAQGCKKDESNGVCGKDKNVCFRLDGEEISLKAVWQQLDNRYRIFWEESEGAVYKKFELDLYGTSTGDYQVDVNPDSGIATLQYFVNESGVITDLQGVSGVVTITSVNSTRIIGTFNAIATDASGATHSFTNGNIASVEK